MTRHLLLVFVALVFATPVLAQVRDLPRTVPRIRPGTAEFGVAGSVHRVDSQTSVGAEVRYGRYYKVGPGLGGWEGAVNYTHYGSRNATGFETDLFWTVAVPGRPIYPFVAIGGGVRQEWLRGPDDTVYPVGFRLGARSLTSETTAFITEYRYRRVLGARFGDYDDSQWRAGVVFFFHNRD